jgi:LIVCS family branched-chain amino acid:cation transporter
VDSPVREGILNGYQAMDVLGALGFAMIIIENVSGRGYTVGRERTKVTTRACVLAGGMLFAVYCGLTYLGATVSQKYDITTVNQAGLIVDITRDMLGTFGVVMLGVIVALACLTTAIGLTSASADYFEHITSGRVSYKAVVIIVSVFSMVVSNFGLSTIISIAVPILSLVYPVVVILIILSFFRRRLLNTNVHKCASLAALIVSALTVISGYGVSMPLLDKLPLASFGLNWIVPAAVFGLLGALIPMKKRGGGPEKAG